MNMKGEPGKWLRFAILFHYDWPGQPDHYDLILEKEYGKNTEEEQLMKFKSVQLPNGKEFSVKFERNIRRRYLKYEGPMSGGRGKVKRIDSGKYDIFGDSIVFDGKRLKGIYFMDSLLPYNEANETEFLSNVQRLAIHPEFRSIS
jgi:hypothetical protein